MSTFEEREALWKWHQAQARWHLKQAKGIFTFQDLCLRTMQKHEKALVKGILQNNALLHKLTKGGLTTGKT